jgi:hypothetical protein
MCVLGGRVGELGMERRRHSEFGGEGWNVCMGGENGKRVCARSHTHTLSLSLSLSLSLCLSRDCGGRRHEHAHVRMGEPSADVSKEGGGSEGRIAGTA